MKPGVFLLTLFLLLPVVSRVSAGASENTSNYKMDVYGWSYGRERKTTTSSNRVTANFSVKNTSTDTVTGIHVTVTLKTGLGEAVANPLSQTIGVLKPGESKKVAVVGDFIPVFNAYDLVIEYADKNEAWFASSDVGQPEPKNGEPLKGTANVIILGKEANSDRAGRFSGKVHVKNDGSVDAKNVKLVITFFDTKKKTIMETTEKLGNGTLAGGVEDNIPFVASKAPRTYGGFELRVTSDDTSAEAAMSGGDFTNAEDVEFAKFLFKRADSKNGSGDLNVNAEVRNGFSTPVEQVKLMLTFQDAKKKDVKKFTYEVPGKLNAGEIKPISFSISELPKYDAFQQAVGYKKIAGKPTEKAKVQADQPKFQNIKDVEVIFIDVMKNDDKSVSLGGALRNGKESPVKDVSITVVFTKTDGSTLATVEKTLTDVVRSTEERNFVMKAPGAADYANYTFSFKYKDAK